MWSPPSPVQTACARFRFATSARESAARRLKGSGLKGLGERGNVSRDGSNVRAVEHHGSSTRSKCASSAARLAYVRSSSPGTGLNRFTQTTCGLLAIRARHPRTIAESSPPERLSSTLSCAEAQAPMQYSVTDRRADWASLAESIAPLRTIAQGSQALDIVDTPRVRSNRCPASSSVTRLTAH